MTPSYTFTLSNTSRKLAGCVDLYLYFNSIASELINENMKWELTNTTTGTTTSGSFANVSDNRLLLKENENIGLSTTYSYSLKIWLNFSYTENQTELGGKGMNAKITSIAYGGACAANKVTTYTSGTNQFTADVDGYYRVETYNVNGSYTTGEIFMAIGEKLYATVSNSSGTPSNVRCYIDSTTGLCGTSSGQNDNNSRIMYAGTNFENSYISGMAGVNSPIYTNSSVELSNNTIHPTGKFFLNPAMEFGTGNTTARIVITYLGKFHERTNIALDNVRYVKDCINGNTSNDLNQWKEIQVIKNGSNIAKGKTVTGTSAQDGSTYAYSLAVNGLITEPFYARSASNGNQCITIDLGKTYDVDEIAVWHVKDGGITYNNNITYVSSNNSSWTEVINRQEPETIYGKRTSAYDNYDLVPRYVSDGLILLYDGINNAGYNHSTNTTTWKDLSGSGNNGTIIDGTWGNNCLSLDGSNDGISIGNSLADLFKSSNTVQVTLKRSETGVRDVIFGNYNASGYVQYEVNDTNRYYITFNGGNGASSGTATYNVPVTLTFKFDKENGTIVVIENITQNTTFTKDAYTTANPTFNSARIGRDSRNNNAVALNGNIYSVRVYNRLLTDEEIANNYEIDKGRFGVN